MRPPVYILHTTIECSQEPEAKYFPLGENVMLFREDLSPVRVFMSFQLDTLHIPIIWFEYTDAKYSSLGENTKL